MRYIAIAFVLVIISGEAYAENNAAIDQCRKHFFNGIKPTFNEEHENKEKAVFLCKKYNKHTFFALSYNNSRKAADWVAYRLSVDNLGPKACRTETRVYWNQFFGMCRKNSKGKTKCNDVYYQDKTLKDLELDGLLSSKSYTGTGFDKGHQAPAAAFAWNGCGWFQTFTMANMSPQRKKPQSEKLEKP